jgi:peptidoglycan/LPS O-acetylase OafA/YrhL
MDRRTQAGSKAFSKSPPSRLVFLESIRGIAAFCVVISHLVITFCPFMQSVEDATWSGRPGWQQWVARSPLNLLYNGHLAVVLFFVLSGFVLSYAYFCSPDIRLVRSAAIRRYFRLAIPMVASALVAWALLATGAMFNRQAAEVSPDGEWIGSLYNLRPSLWGAIKQSLWDVFMRYDARTTYNVALWTMPIELAGSFFVYSFVALFGTMHRRWIVYLALATILLAIRDVNMLDFLAGIALCDVFVAVRIGRAGLPRPRSGAVFACLMTGLLLAAHKGNQIHLGLVAFRFSGASVLNTLGVILILGSLLVWPGAQRWLERPWLRLLGTCSFPIYLIHIPLICSVGCYIYWLARTGAQWGHGTAAVMSSAAVVGCVLAASWVLEKVADQPSIRFGKWFEMRLFGRSLRGSSDA